MAAINLEGCAMQLTDKKDVPYAPETPPREIPSKEFPNPSDDKPHD